MKRKAITGLLFVVLIVASTAEGADIKKMLDEAAQLAEKGQVIRSSGLLRQAMAAVWALKPILIKRALLVEREAPLYGHFLPRKDNVYKPGEPILVYVEPAAYRFKQAGEQYSFGFSADFAVLSPDGKVLAGRRQFNRWEFRSSVPLFEIFLNLTYNLTGAPSGKYLIETTLHDMHSEARVSFRLPVIIKP